MKRRTFLAWATIGAVLGLLATAALGAEAARIGKDELKSRLGDPGLQIIDVRSYTDWIFSGSKIKGAAREDYRDFSAWAAKYPKDKTIVLYCA